MVPRAEVQHRTRRRHALDVVVLLLLALLPLQASIRDASSAAASKTTTNRAAETPKVFLALENRKVTTKQHARARVVVVSSRASRSQKVFGRVKVVVKGGGKTRSVLAAMSGHRKVVALPKLPRGFYKVRGEFLGNESLGKAHRRFKKQTVPRAGTGAGGGGGAFPNASNTGVPAGVTLKPYRGPCTITADNTVIDSKSVSCYLSIQAKNVVIRNSSLKQVQMDQDIMHAQGKSGWSFSVTDSNVDGGSVDGPGICCGNYNVLRVEMRGGHNGAQCENDANYCNLTDSWIHGQYEPAGGTRHLGGFLNDGGTPSTLIHNSITCEPRAENDEGGCSGDINLIANFGVMASVSVQNNFLGANANSAFCTYAGATPGTPSYASQSNHIVYLDNVFERADRIANPAAGQPASTNRCAAYGPVSGFDSSGPGNVWTGNHYDDGTAIVCTANKCM